MLIRKEVFLSMKYAEKSTALWDAILGIGGGMIITPIITLALGLDIKYAIGASIITY